MTKTAAIQAGARICWSFPLAWLVIGWLLNRWLRGVIILAQDTAGRGIESREGIAVEGVPTKMWPLVEAMNKLTDDIADSALRIQKARLFLPRRAIAQQFQV